MKKPGSACHGRARLQAADALEISEIRKFSCQYSWRSATSFGGPVVASLPRSSTSGGGGGGGASFLLVGGGGGRLAAVGSAVGSHEHADTWRHWARKHRAQGECGSTSTERAARDSRLSAFPAAESARAFGENIHGNLGLQVKRCRNREAIVGGVVPGPDYLVGALGAPKAVRALQQSQLACTGPTTVCARSRPAEAAAGDLPESPVGAHARMQGDSGSPRG